MPIYEYLCEDCGSRFEKLVRGDAAGLTCPGCGKSHLEQQLSTFAAHSGSNGGAAAQTMGGGCPAGMCRTPDVCGRK